MEHLYEAYCKYIETFVDKPVSEWTFKSAPEYTGMLEHPGLSGYEELIEAEFPAFIGHERDKVLELIRQNDSIGAPIKQQHKHFGLCSPTNLRYIYHSLLALKHLKEVEPDLRVPIHVVEIGGGYGGLCFYFTHFAKLAGWLLGSYTLIDLSAPLWVQQQYLAKLSIVGSVNFLLVPGSVNFLCSAAYSLVFNSASEMEQDYFLISNYCLSEISPENREDYYKDLLPHCPHGFLVWNGEKIDLPKSYTKEPERPGDPATQRHSFVYF